MWKKSYSKTFQGIKREDAWRILTDINNWPKWHNDLDDCRLEGHFSAGDHFFLQPKGMKPIKIMLTEIHDGFSFTDCTSFFGAKMYDTHSLEETPEGLKITNTLIVTGPLKWVWIKLVAQNVAKTARDEAEALIKRVESFYG